MGKLIRSILSSPPWERDWRGPSVSAHPCKSRCAPGFSRGPRRSTSGTRRGRRVSYYHRGDFLSDLGGGIYKISSFANFIPGVGSAIGAVGSLFGGGKPSPVPMEQQIGMSPDQFINMNNQIMEMAKRFRAPMTSPGAPIADTVVLPQTRPPVEFYASTPDVDYDYFEEEDYG